MARCDICGNDYEKSFQIIMEGTTRTFDSFECAIEACAPTCANCGCKIIGHGVETAGEYYCRMHCARHANEKDVQERAQT